MKDHEDGFTELKIKKPNGIFTINQETRTGKNMLFGVNSKTTNNANDAINELIILSINVDNSILVGDTKFDKKV
jgi:hypothetical protein